MGRPLKTTTKRLLPIALPIGMSDEIKRDKDGTFAETKTAKQMGAVGGKARSRHVKILKVFGFTNPGQDSAFTPYRKAADEATAKRVKELMDMAGDDVNDTTLMTYAAASSLQMAAAMFCMNEFEKTGDIELLDKMTKHLAESQKSHQRSFSQTMTEANVKANPANAPLPWIMAPPDPDNDGDND